MERANAGDPSGLERVAVVTGVGAGTGAALARRFSAGGYKVAMLARNGDRLAALEAELTGARAYLCDVSDLDAVSEMLGRVRDELGVPRALVHNAISATFKPFLEASVEELERNFRVNTTSLFHMARELAPAMIESGQGAIIATGNTAAFRGIPRYAAFAPTKAAQRILAQALARDLGPRGIHVAYLNIDAVIDTPWTRDAFHPDEPDEFFSLPRDIAEEAFRVAHQPRSAWSFDVELRPYAERW